MNINRNITANEDELDLNVTCINYFSEEIGNTVHKLYNIIASVNTLYNSRLII